MLFGFCFLIFTFSIHPITVNRVITSPPTFQFEQALLSGGYLHIAGIDEVGRGCWAGPVVAAAVIFPARVREQSTDLSHWAHKVRDSKQLSAKLRQELALQIQAECQWAIGESSASTIDSQGIRAATALAMKAAVDRLEQMADQLLVDGNDKFEFEQPAQFLIKGDSLSLSIAAASIIAKVYRDKLMAEYDREYPGYDFATHVGYGTKAHQQALAELGTCRLHRHSFKPIQKLAK